MVSREITTHSFLLLSGNFGMLFSVDLFDFERTYEISTYAKTHFWLVYYVKRFPTIFLTNDFNLNEFKSIFAEENKADSDEKYL